MSDKPKRVLSEEQLEKLKLAREKAMMVRKAKAEKMNQIKKLEKEAQEKELNDKLEEVKKKVSTPSYTQDQDEDNNNKIKKGSNIVSPSRRKSKAQIIKNVVEEESEDSQSDSDEEESVVNPVKTFLKEKYKQKYKQKYESKHLNNLVKHSAQNHLRSRIDEEVFRLAQQAMFS